MSDIYGTKSLELSENVSQIGLFSKMSLALFPILTPSLKIWKRKDTIGGRSLFRLATSVPRTKEKGYGLLPTVTASDATAGSIIGKNDTFKMTGNNTLRRYTQNGHNSGLSLGRLLTLKNGLDLLPTPQASDYRERGNLSNPCIQKRIQKGKQIMLSMILTTPNLLATPTASQASKPIRHPSPSRINGDHGMDVQDSIGKTMPNMIGKKINPQFLEWMMGVPMDYTKISHCQE